MLLAISNRYIHYSYSYTMKRQSYTKHTTANMDRQKQTDYTVKPRERYAIMVQHYTGFRYSQQVIQVQISGSTERSVKLRKYGNSCSASDGSGCARSVPAGHAARN